MEYKVLNASKNDCENSKCVGSNIIIPIGLRRFLHEHNIATLHITRGVGRCLFLFNSDEWEMKRKAVSTGGKFDKLLFSGSDEVRCDKQGRISVPKYLKDFAHIKKDIVVIRFADRIEIWAKERMEGKMGTEKKKKTVHKDFKEHDFDRFIDMVDKGEEIHKIYECECGARMIDVYLHVREDYEGCSK